MRAVHTETLSRRDDLPLRRFGHPNERQVKLWSSLSEVCETLGTLPFEEDGLLFQHLKYKPGQRVYTMSQPFESLYVVYSGFLKTVMVDEAGHEQVLGFPMKGDLLGADGIDAGTYQTEVLAQTLCELIVLPYKTLVELGRKMPQLELEILAVMSRELARQQRLLFTLCSLPAEARVARFLSSLSERYAAMGCSSTAFTLRMTRQEIGSYLGLALETVSRVLQALQQAGLIAVDQKEITIRRPEVLQAMRRLPPGSRHALAKR